MNTIMKLIRYTGLIAALLTTAAGWGQDETDDLGTETVTVVRSYTPTVSDARKIQSLPSLQDSIALQKKPVQYEIHSVPVASTFTPAKGQAAAVERARPEKLFNSYAALGLGNYNNALADFYISRDFDRGNKRIDVGLNHLSSRGDIDGTPLDTDFYNSGLDVTYSQRDRDWEWNASAGMEHRRYNWYGVDTGLLEEGETSVAGIDETQDYFRGSLQGQVHMEDTYFTDAELQVSRFWDAVESAENRLRFTAAFEFPVTEESLGLGLEIDYLGGHFENAPQSQYINDTEIDYQYLIAGVRPGLLMLRDDLKLFLGARITAGLDLENSENNFYIYPSVEASYNLLEENVIAYGGVDGGLDQNSYYEFSRVNPFVSPTLAVMPTDRQYEAYLGLKGQLTPSVSYNLKGSYAAENFKPLFILNPINETRNDEKGYIYGNSFRVFYDDIRTLGVFGELQFSVNRNFSLGLNASVYEYDTETDNPAWNLPNLEGNLTLDYQHDSGWYLGANLFYVGEREDFVSRAQPATPPDQFPAQQLTLDGYFDANARVGYHINPQLSIFARGSNLAGNQYQRWANFRVQGLQVLAGVSYKFDL
ncbi:MULTISPECIES: TonB-dependent receptor domain-containing protein [unclassified Robiginitalea]|uniref:TonB-dependent receptor domain-containing protein n=1 Tax=Robiginitalea TaxID=252306 RepID=UPI00234B5132|nr:MULTISPECIES: TonB-dependent receptor [unclassified Robiginitalea]MDC6355412.1 TonB-dependent receptor [Robiginitalea sp. PM2]MDC6375373.1 TonB-dependent receptor [Robiginitalea sp. SP8]